MTTPAITPLERLQVNDGLLLTADRWQIAHAYHRQRQNLHYQSLNQAGIVCGLGVSVVDAPTEISAQYRDRRWVQIQPGVAIDSLGNPIVIPNPVDYRITATPSSDTKVVYLVARYVDPDRLETKEQRETVQETFRIDEKTTPPDTFEVELCRIQLSDQTDPTVHLEPTTNVFAPQVNQLNLGHRLWVEPKALATVQVGKLCSPETSNQGLHHAPVAERFKALFDSLPGLYPRIQGNPTLKMLTTHPEPGGEAIVAEALKHIDLVYAPYDLFIQLDIATQETYGEYLQSGGVVVFEIPEEITTINELVQVQDEIRTALSNLKPSRGPSNLYQELMTELEQLQTTIDEEISQLIEPVLRFSDTMGLSAADVGQLTRDHLLRSQPFRFLQFPRLNHQPLEILNWGGIVVIIGQLTQYWGAEDTLLLSREELRSAQELGINLLHFAWQRRHYHACLRTQSPPPAQKVDLFNEII